MNPFDAAIAAGLQVVATVAGKPAAETVSYARSGQTSIELDSPVQGQSDWESDQVGGLLAWEGVDWLFPASQLATWDDPEPARGDTIAHTDAGGTVRTYTVMAPPGQDCYRFMDRNRLWLRVHTKLTSEA